MAAKFAGRAGLRRPPPVCCWECAAGVTGAARLGLSVVGAFRRRSVLACIRFAGFGLDRVRLRCGLGCRCSLKSVWYQPLPFNWKPAGGNELGQRVLAALRARDERSVG